MTSIRVFTKTQIKVILILMDDEGYAEREIAGALGAAESNLSPKLYDLVKRGVIFKGKGRTGDKEPPISDKIPERRYKKMRTGRYSRSPYFLEKDLKALRTIIAEIQRKRSSICDSMFLINAILKSKYGQAMKKQFPKDKIKAIIDEELLESGKNFIESPIYKDVAELSMNLIRNSPVPEELDESWELDEIEMWYHSYLSNISRKG